VLRKRTRNFHEDDGPDVPADNPVGTMDRFMDGLRRVLSAPKTTAKSNPPPRRKKRKRGV
jgi:hypothetical protein